MSRTAAAIRTGPTPNSAPGDQADWRPVGLFLSGQGLSLICDQVFFIAVLWAAAQRGGNLAVTWVTVGESVPRTLMTIFGGVICDAFGPRAVLLRTTSVRIAVLGTASAVALSVHAVWLLVLVAVLEGSMLGLGSASFSTLLPRMVSKDQLNRANSMRTTTARFAPILGPPFAAWLVATGHLPAALIVACVGCVISQLCVRWVTRSAEVKRSGGKPLWRRSGAGFRLLLADARLRWLFLSAMCLDLAFAWPLNPGLPVIVLHRGWGVSAVGLLIACFGAGSLVSAMAGAALGERLPIWLRFVGCGAGVAAALLAMILALSLPTMAAAAAALGVFSGQNGPAVATLYMRASPRDQLGVAMSMLSLSGIGIAPVAYAVFGAIASVTSPTTAWITCAVVAFGAPVAAVRALRIPPPDSPERPVAS